MREGGLRGIEAELERWAGGGGGGQIHRSSFVTFDLGLVSGLE